MQTANTYQIGTKGRGVYFFYYKEYLKLYNHAVWLLPFKFF